MKPPFVSVNSLSPMSPSAPSCGRCWPVLLLLFVVASGCRTYGGYGTESGTLDQIQQANQQFADELARAEGEGNALRQAVARYPVLAPIADDYEDTLERHRTMIVHHREMLDRAAATSGVFAWLMQTRYRTISRIYGGILSEQQVVRDRYLEAYQAVAQALGRPPVAWINTLTTAPRSRYYVVPPQYEDIRQVPTLSMRDLLDG